MARQESDREDLLREATALVERAELRLAGQPEPITVGFRRDGSLSVYFGADPVYQFNTANELRRAYASGLLYKAEAGRLVSLRRERSAAETALVRHELTPEETAAFLAQVQQHLRLVFACLTAGDHLLLRHFPSTANLLPRIIDWLRNLPTAISIARAPHAR